MAVIYKNRKIVLAASLAILAELICTVRFLRHIELYKFKNSSIIIEVAIFAFLELLILLSLIKDKYREKKIFWLAYMCLTFFRVIQNFIYSKEFGADPLAIASVVIAGISIVLAITATKSGSSGHII